VNIAVDLSNTILTTERLILRPWKESDLEDFFEYASVDGVGQMAGWLPHKNRDESRIILQSFIRDKKTFALEHEGKVIGSVGIEVYPEYELPEFDHLRGREIGYVLSKDYWGRGLMPEAVRRVLSYLFDELKLDFVLCGYYVFNRQSARVQEKCGFRLLKQVRHETRYGIVHDTNLNILYASDFVRPQTP